MSTYLGGSLFLFGDNCPLCGLAPEYCRCPQEGQDELFGAAS